MVFKTSADGKERDGVWMVWFGRSGACRVAICGKYNAGVGRERACASPEMAWWTACVSLLTPHDWPALMPAELLPRSHEPLDLPF